MGRVDPPRPTLCDPFESHRAGCGSTRVDPSRLNGTGQIRPVTNHGTNRVGENFPRPLFFLFSFFKSYIIIYVRGEN